MDESFFFYDLETSGINPRTARVMQFAGQRTDKDLKAIGEPYNLLIKLSEDILPDPDAILVTGITLQKTLEEGITEAKFCQLFYKEIVQPKTTFVGFNNIRFDDEFMRFMFFRNFHDPYEWQWKDGSSRWDLLDLVRMTRALRPEGIKWPVDENGAATCRLELLTQLNGLDHANAHDALNDVNASVGLAQLIREKQPKLFDFLYSMRTKAAVAELANSRQPFVYSSGKYPAEFEKTAVVATLGDHPDRQGVLVYNLRHDPSPFLEMQPAELAKLWQYDKEKKSIPLPVKTLQFNRAPAIAPLGVLDESSRKRLKIDLGDIKKHIKILAESRGFMDKLQSALTLLNKERSRQSSGPNGFSPPDTQLYEEFISDSDKKLATKIHSSLPEELNAFAGILKDSRLKQILPLYKARNFSYSLSGEELEAWEEYRKKVLLSGGENSRAAKFSKRLVELSQKSSISDDQRYLLEEVHLYGTSILPDL